MLSKESYHQEIAEQLPDFVLNKHRDLLRKAKTLDLLEYMSEGNFPEDSLDQQLKKSDDLSEEQLKLIRGKNITNSIPFISKSLFKNEKKFVDILYNFLFFSPQNNTSAQMTFNFFSLKSNKEHFKYFVQCCFPSMFNYFSSFEYSYCAYNFIKNIINIEISNSQSENPYILTYDSLIVEYLLHNFQFRLSLQKSFHLRILKDPEMQNINIQNMNKQNKSNEIFKKVFSFLILAFKDSISYLDQNQLKILKLRITSDKIKNYQNDILKKSDNPPIQSLASDKLEKIKNVQLTISIFQQIFIKLLKTWRYSPQFCTNEIFNTFPDNPSQKKSNNDELNANCLIGFISKYVYDPNDENISRALGRLCNNRMSWPFTKRECIRNLLNGKDDFLVLSDYDVMLISWILMQSSDITPIDGTNMTRNYQRQQDYCSKESSLRFFYVRFNIKADFRINFLNSILVPISPKQSSEIQEKGKMKEQPKGKMKEQPKGKMKEQPKGKMKEQPKGKMKEQAKGKTKNQNKTIKQVEKEKEKEKNKIRNSITPFYCIDKEIEACKKIKTSVFLKYSDTIEYQDYPWDWTLIRPPDVGIYPDEEKPTRRANEAKSFWMSNLKSYLFSQEVIHLNCEKIDITANIDYSYATRFSNNIKYALFESLSFKNADQSDKKQAIYYKGFRYLSIIELSQEKYSFIDINREEQGVENNYICIYHLPKALNLLQKVKESFKQKDEELPSLDEYFDEMQSKVLPKLQKPKSKI